MVGASRGCKTSKLSRERAWTREFDDNLGSSATQLSAVRGRRKSSACALLAAAVVLAAMILASALLAKPSGDGASVENHIALVVFVVAVVVSLGMLARIALQSRKVRTGRHR